LVDLVINQTCAKALGTAAELASWFHGTINVSTDETPTYALRQMPSVNRVATGTCFVGLFDSSPDADIASNPTNA